MGDIPQTDHPGKSSYQKAMERANGLAWRSLLAVAAISVFAWLNVPVFLPPGVISDTKFWVPMVFVTVIILAVVPAIAWASSVQRSLWKEIRRLDSRLDLHSGERNP